MLTIAIDFDNTFTADPVMWSKFIRDARTAGHRVVCVTSRRQTTQNNTLLDEMFKRHGIEIATWFTSLASKTWYMQQVGVKVDIWIDDDPKTLVDGH